MLFDRHSLRHAARIILMAWLFAFGAGIANACLLNSSHESGHHSIQGIPAEPAVSSSHHGENTDPADAGCMKFCGEAALAITKVDPPIADGDQGWVGISCRASGTTIASATAVQIRAHATSPPHLALPIAERPHRLTL